MIQITKLNHYQITLHSASQYSKILWSDQKLVRNEMELTALHATVIHRGLYGTVMVHSTSVYSQVLTTGLAQFGRLPLSTKLTPLQVDSTESMFGPTAEDIKMKK